MSNKLKKASFAAGAVTVVSGRAGAAEKKRVDGLIAKIRDKSDKVRAEGLLSAVEVGAPAVKPLAKVMEDDDIEVMRAGKRALWKIVRNVGRPGAGDEKKAVVANLKQLLGDEQSVFVRREALWMLSEIGGDETVKSVAALLSDEKVREDARMVLQRIPGRQSLEALKDGLKSAPMDFRLNIAQSLRQRGLMIRRPASVKLVPTKKTKVKPLKQGGN
jgi:HEAT repeat protein